jgi:cytoskeletal protein RodZ
MSLHPWSSPSDDCESFLAYSNMLLVKCPNCEASYKLSEELYRRKAAGFGVVVTCRHCKTEIHVDEHGNAVAAPSDDSAPDATTVPPAPVLKKAPPVIAPPNANPPLEDGSAEQTPIAAALARAAAGPPRPNAGAPRPKLTVGRIQASPTAIGGLGPYMPSAPKQPTAAAVTPAAPSVPVAPIAPSGVGNVVTNQPAPKPAPRPPARTVRQPTLIGLRPPKDEPSSPKLVALSPGLLNIDDDVTRVLRAPDLPPPPPPVPPPPPEDPITLAPASDGDGDGETHRPPPLAAPDLSDLEELDLPIASEDMLPDSSSEITRTVDAEELMGSLPKPKLPQAPPIRKMPTPLLADATAEPPSMTSAPKIDTLVHDLPPKPSKAPKKPPAPSDDFFGESQGGFDTAAPPIAPPDAGALTRRPLSSRPEAAAIATKPSIQLKKQRKNRALVWLLALGAIGAAALFLRDRLHLTSRAAPELPQPAVPTTAAPAPPPAAPAETAEPTISAEPASTEIAAAPSASTPPAAASATPTPPAPTAAPALAATTPTARPTTTPAATPTSVATAKPTSAPAAAPIAATKPTSTPTYEPAGSVGTEPFDSAAARSALDAAAAQASSCRKPGDPSGVAVVTITYSPTGRVTSANIGGPPFQATPTGGCIASTMRKARVPPFAGDMVTVRKTVSIN